MNKILPDGTLSDPVPFSVFRQNIAHYKTLGAQGDIYISSSNKIAFVLSPFDEEEYKTKSKKNLLQYYKYIKGTQK